MNPELLKLKPKRFRCPICGEWHNWEEPYHLGYYNPNFPAKFTNRDSYSYPVMCAAENYTIFVDGKFLYYTTASLCDYVNLNLNGKIPIESIAEFEEKPIVRFNVLFHIENPISRAGSCRHCLFRSQCNILKLVEKEKEDEELWDSLIVIPLGFEFEEEEYFQIVGNSQKAEQQTTSCLQEEEQKAEPQTTICLQEEEQKMAEKTTILTSLYEKSPKENLELLKTWAEKYKPTLKWVVPVGAVYLAYRILNSKIFDVSVNNVAETCEKKLGFKIPYLEDQKTLKELMALGGIASAAYFGGKVFSSIVGANKPKEELSAEDVEKEMDKLSAISQKFAWIRPKTEDLLPVAISVILVFVTLHKPKALDQVCEKASETINNLLGDFKIKLNLWGELAKAFIQDKFGIDLSDEEQAKKAKVCTFLLIVVGVLVFLYGKKLLKKDAGDSSEEPSTKIKDSVQSFMNFAKATLEKLAPTLYTTVVTFLISSKILEMSDFEVVAESEIVDSAKESDDQEKVDLPDSQDK